MKLQTKIVGDVAVVHNKGKLIGGPENFENFHGTFRRILDEGYNKVVVDLGNTPWANSQGIGMLMGARTSIMNAGGELVLARAENRIRDILSITRLLLIFEDFPTVDDAVAHFQNE